MSCVKRVFSSLIAVLIVFSISISSVSVYAASDNEVKRKISATTVKKNRFAKAYIFKAQGKTSYGYDYSYNLYSKDIKVSCKYDFKKKEYRFKVTGKKYGLSKLELKYKSGDNKWVVVPMRVFVDPDGNIMRTTVKL